MPFTFSANDLFSLFYAFGGLRALTRLFRNWRAFWDNQVTTTDRALAGDLALFVLVPLAGESGATLRPWPRSGGWRPAFVAPRRQPSRLPHWPIFVITTTRMGSAGAMRSKPNSFRHEIPASRRHRR